MKNFLFFSLNFKKFKIISKNRIEEKKNLTVHLILKICKKNKKNLKLT